MESAVGTVAVPATNAESTGRRENGPRRCRRLGRHDTLVSSTWACAACCVRCRTGRPGFRLNMSPCFADHQADVGHHQEQGHPGTRRAFRIECAPYQATGMPQNARIEPPPPNQRACCRCNRISNKNTETENANLCRDHPL